MRKYSFLTAVAAVLTLVVLGTVPASAIPFTAGSFAFSSTTTTTTNASTTTSFDLVPADMHGLSGGTGSFTLYPFPPSLAITTPLVFTTPGAGTFNWSDAGLGTFAADTVTSLGAGCIGLFCFANYGVTGTYTIGTGFDNPGTVLSASETWGLTQTGGAGSAISMSGTFNSPSAFPNPVPEPATLALVITGLAGLAGLGALRRRRKS